MQLPKLFTLFFCHRAATKEEAGIVYRRLHH